MFTPEEFAAWCHEHQVSEQAQIMMHQIRSSGPVRRVGQGRANVSGRYPSRKMGMTIQFESHRVELAAIYEWEHDVDVLEYYDQPSSILLDYRSATGRRVVVRHTPDYFVIRRHSAQWIECKTEEELRRLTQHTPNCYAWDGAAWRCPPGEAYASRFGLHYRVWSAHQVNWVLQRNLQFLDDYLRMDRQASDPDVCEQVVAHVAAAPGQSLEALFVATQETATRDQLYRMIAAGDLYVDLHTTPLVEPSRVFVFPRTARALVDLQSRVPHTSHADPVHTGTSGALPASAGQVPTCLPHARTEDLQVANRRYAILRRILRGEPLGPDEHIPGRTLRRWRARYDEAEQASGSGYLGLLPQTTARGNATHKLPEATRAVLSDVIAKEYETLKQKTKMACWAAVKVACEAQGLRAPSYKTVRVAIGQRAGYRQTVTRKGQRAAYAQEPFYWTLTPTTPRHGDRPFEIVHIDHTELDLQTVCSRTGRPLGRPWLTLLIDAYSRRILAFALLYDSPSYRSCMMVIRACVQRHERLPQILVVDGGREFQSTYFETLLARYECSKKTRPPAKARFGAVCERLFGTTNTQFLYNLRGNTQLSREARHLTKAVDPKGQAVWSLAELSRCLAQYLYDVYDTADHPALGQSPRAHYDDGLTRTGLRPQRRIAYDEQFRLFTLPTTARGQAKIIPGRGVKIRYLYYWSELFRDPQVAGRTVGVRYDPFDAGTVYICVRGSWTACHSEYYPVFHGRTEREIMLATTELHRRQRMHAAGVAVTARRLAEFLQSVEAEEGLLLQRLRDREHRAVGIASTRRADNDDGGDASPAPTPPLEALASGAAEDIKSDVYGEF